MQHRHYQSSRLYMVEAIFKNDGGIARITHSYLPRSFVTSSAMKTRNALRDARALPPHILILRRKVTCRRTIARYAVLSDTTFKRSTNNDRGCLQLKYPTDEHSSFECSHDSTEQRDVIPSASHASSAGGSERMGIHSTSAAAFAP